MVITQRTDDNLILLCLSTDLSYCIACVSLKWLIILISRSGDQKENQSNSIYIYLSDKTLNRWSFRRNAFESSSKVISPDWSTSVSWKRVAVNSATVSSMSNEGDCSKKQRSNNFISSKSITPSPREQCYFTHQFYEWREPTITIKDFEEEFHFLGITSRDDKFEISDKFFQCQSTRFIRIQIIE